MLNFGDSGSIEEEKQIQNPKLMASNLLTVSGMKTIERRCTLPDDLIQDIMSRLTVRDLLRLRCVSKEWCALIDNPCFIKKHYQVQYSICKVNGNLPHFVDIGYTGYTNKFYLLSIQQEKVITLDLNSVLERDSKDGLNYGLCLFDLLVDGCVNGIICLTWNNQHDLRRKYMGLWNPATREFKTVAGPNVHRNYFRIHGFGFDPLWNDFKILGSYCIVRDGVISQYYKIYWLRTNSWKSVKGPPDYVGGVPLHLTDGYLNGMYYWSWKVVEESGGGDLVIVSFNFSSEVFKVSDPPEDAVSLLYGIYPFQVTTTLYKESLGLFISHEVQEEAAMYNVDVWVVTQFDDYGMPLSWQHLFTVGPTPAKLGLKVSTTRINGDLLLAYHFPSEDNYEVEEAESCLYNPSTGEFKMLGTHFCTYNRYVESLFPLSKRAKKLL